MSSENKKYLITSALPYVNGIPHLGHMIGCLLPSDVYARFCRSKGREVLYIGGTDEYGTPSEVGAIKEGMTFEDYTAKYFKIHEETYSKWGLSFDKLGRTSTEKQNELVQYVFVKLYKAGFIEEKIIKQVFSIDDNRFLADRYIEGTCPKCGYDKARGDQCDKCNSLLNPVDLIKPHSVISGSEKLEVRETKHLFLKLESMQGLVEKWIATRKGWSNSALSIAKKWLDEGLHDRCITRDLKWGVPVPAVDGLEGYENKVFYVWFDAPWGYVSISQAWAEEYKKLGEATRNWESFWKPQYSDDVKYVQFMGKDNVPFHSVFFPAEQLALGENWKTVDVIKGMNFLNFKDGKFSKSLGNGFSALDAIKEFPADYWRYWLMANAPETDDAVFTWEKFASDINSDLNNVLGNLVSRVVKFTEKSFESDYELPDEYVGIDFSEWDNRLEKLVIEFDEFMDALEFRKAMAKLRETWALGNEFIDNFAPWKVIKEYKDKAADICLKVLNYINIISVISKPIIPNTCYKIRKFLTQSSFVDLNDPNAINPGPLITHYYYNYFQNDNSILNEIKNFKQIDKFPEDILFNKIDEDMVKMLEEKYKA